MFKSICYNIKLYYCFIYRCLLIAIQRRKNCALWTHVPPTLYLERLNISKLLRKKEGNIMTIAGCDALIVGSGQATITRPIGTQITIEDALLYHDLTRTFLSYRDIRKNGFHVETHEDNKEEFLLFTKLMRFGKQICEKISSLPTGLYFYIHQVYRTCRL